MDEKIIQKLISNEISNEIMDSFLIEGEQFCSTHSDLIKETINSIYIQTCKIKDIKLSMHLYEEGEINLDHWNTEIDNNYLTKSFVLFLNKPESGGHLIIQNPAKEKSAIDCDGNKLVIFSADCKHYTTSSPEDRYVIEGKIYFNSKIN